MPCGGSEPNRINNEVLPEIFQKIQEIVEG
jgi:hypothetical protein